MSNIINHAMLWQFRSIKVLTFLGMLLLTCPTWAQRQQVEIKTELGTIVVELYNETPLHRDNFLKLVDQGAYDSLLIHRVIPGFMFQGGDPKSRTAGPGVALGAGGQTYTIPAEILPNVIHKRGALCAARQPDDENPEKASSGGQFYVVTGRSQDKDDLQRLLWKREAQGDTLHYTEANFRDYTSLGGAPHLDGNYTIFGEVIEGFDVLDSISSVACDVRDRPLIDIRMFMRLLK